MSVLMMTKEISNASRETKIDLIRIKLSSLETALGRMNIVFDKDTQVAATQTMDSLSEIIDDPRSVWQREDPWSDFVQLLGRLTILDDVSVSSIVDQLAIATGLHRAMAVLQLRKEAFSLSVMWHKAVYRLARCDPYTYDKHLARSLM